MKNEVKLRRICSEFRRGILGNKTSDNMCFAVAAPLEGYLRALGYKVNLVEGDFGRTNHFWLKFSDGTIVDPTADQFKKPSGQPMPKIYIGRKPEWYKDYD